VPRRPRIFYDPKVNLKPYHGGDGNNYDCEDKNV